MADAAALHEEMFETADRRDLVAFRDLFHPEYTYVASDGSVALGPDGGLAVAKGFFDAFPDLVLERTHQYAASGDVSIIEFVATGTHTGPLGDIPATGKTVRMTVCDVIEVKDGKIYREREYYDMMSMMQQLGLMPAEG